MRHRPGPSLARPLGRGRGGRLVRLGLAVALVSAGVAAAPSVVGTAAAATAQTFTGSVSASGVSWYAHDYTATGAGPLTVDLDWATASANLNVFVKDASGAVLAGSKTTDSRPKSVTVDLPAAGDYKLGVKAVSGTSDYTLRATLDASAPPPPDGTQRFTGTVDSAGVSWSATSVTVPADGEVTAKLSWATTSANLNVFLKDAAGAVVAGSRTVEPQPKTIRATVAAGDYKVGVKAVSGASDYTVDVTLPAAPPPPPPPPGTTFTGTVDAAGTFWRAHTFDVTAPATITGSLDWATASANLSLFLKDPDGKVVASSASAAKPEELSLAVQRTGTYLFGVKAVTGSSDYTITWSAGGSPPPPPPPPPPAPVGWPTLQRDAQHLGLSDEQGISSATADKLAVRWAMQTGDSAFSSPAIVPNATLGKTLVYSGNQLGTFAAYDAATGDRLWHFDIAGNISSSPTVVGNTVYFGAADKKLYALNATTGALQCSYTTPGVIYSSPLVVDADGSGLLVYFGDVGLTGGNDGGTFYAINGVDPNPAANCTLKWKYDQWGDPPGSQVLVGSYSSPAFAKGVDGVPVVVAGGSSPENAVYAWNALTGQRLWRYKTQSYYQDEDVAAAPTISLPGANGFADGVVYVPAKNRIMYALNLRTGAKIWEFRVRDDSPGLQGSTRSSAALDGRRLYFGYGAGMYALDAVTGAKLWKTGDSTPGGQEIISSVAVSGPANSRVLFGGDLTGKVYGFDAATGALRWSYQTSNFIYGSAGVHDGSLYISSADGFLYAFSIPTGQEKPPATAISTPAEGATLANPNGSLTVTGTATDNSTVGSVRVAVKDTNLNRWLDPASGQWVGLYTEAPATLAGPATSRTWSYAFPVPFDGSQYQVFAYAVDDGGRHTPLPVNRSFTVSSAGSPPDTTITEPAPSQVYYFPTARDSFPITVRGHAVDSGGAHPGITKVVVTVMNIEHGEYFCGAPGCNGGAGSGEASEWTPTRTTVLATLASPGAPETDWTLTFPTYDHPHKYRITAYAQDADGEVDSTPAQVLRICVRDPGDKSCV